MSWESDKAAAQPRDGRYIDTRVAVLEGEGASQETRPKRRTPPPETASHLLPTAYYESEPTYYDKPAIKPPVWIWSIPVYFFVGGVAGAAMVLAFASQLFGGRKMRAFDERCRWIGAIGGGVGSALLIHDLGRKTRFLFMLRVFRPTSPMSVGSWVLASATPLSAGSALLTMSKGDWKRLGDAAGIAAGVLGMPLATYTAVLIANSAVPVWQASRRSLPLLFGASSIASLGSILDLMPLAPRERAIAHRFGTIGRAAELWAGSRVERDAGHVPGVARPLHEGFSGTLWTAAKVMTAASLGLSLVPKPSRAVRITAGTLGALGGLCVRFAIFRAGKKSALDPRATFRQQRAGYGAAEVAGPEPRPVPQPRPFEEFVKV